MILIDTGYFVALLDDRDELHDRALEWSNAIHETALITEYVLVETVNLLSKTEDRPKAHALLRHIESSAGYEVVSASADLFQAGRGLHESCQDKTWSLTDCISFVVMNHRGIRRALAYDKHFEQAGVEPLLRREP